MKPGRSSGILLHPTSLPGRYGIGDLGVEAYRFADFLAAAGQRLWQVLPLGPTGFGDSPYQCFSAFAGNPLLISLEKLIEQGYLSTGDVQTAPRFSKERVDYGAVMEFRLPLLRKAYAGFREHASPIELEGFEKFCGKNEYWLEDYALFMAVKEAHYGLAWTLWDPDIAFRRPEAGRKWSLRLCEEIQTRKFWEYLFFQQWSALKDYCHGRGILLMGDIPVYVAHDSADVWKFREFFLLDDSGHPTVVAGVPPDYFSATGQLWGNPIYRWDLMAEDHFTWWIRRLQSTLSLVDIARLDHFRGFAGYWEVPAGEEMAVKGRWVKGPGAELFDTVLAALGELPIVAENLGLITPDVIELKERYGFPGMAVLQFAFGTDPLVHDYHPPSFERNLVIYTGTHDNDTTLGWWNNTSEGDSTRSPEEIRLEHGRALDYLNSDGSEINWGFIRAALASPANTAVTPLQDVLGLGSEARMNQPGRPDGNWRWRFTSDMLTQAVQERLKEMTLLYHR
jgi:4-alpha-glucanotransferase